MVKIDNALYYDKSAIDLKLVEAKLQTGKQPFLMGSYATLDNFMSILYFQKSKFRCLKDVVNSEEGYKGHLIKINDNIPFGIIYIGVD